MYKYGNFGARFVDWIYAAWMLALLLPIPYCGVVSLGVKWVSDFKWVRVMHNPIMERDKGR